MRGKELGKLGELRFRRTLRRWVVGKVHQPPTIVHSPSTIAQSVDLRFAPAADRSADDRRPGLTPIRKPTNHQPLHFCSVLQTNVQDCDGCGAVGLA